MVAYRKWFFIRGFNCKALTGKVLMFWIRGCCTWGFDCSTKYCRAVSKISGYQASNTITGEGIERLGISYGSFFFYFPVIKDRGHIHSRKSPAPGLKWQPQQAIWYYVMVRFRTIDLKLHLIAQFEENHIIREKMPNSSKENNEFEL